MPVLNVVPSLIAANAGYLVDTIRALDGAGADVFHWDIMDGHFVPNLTFGPHVIADCRHATTKEFDIHLLVSAPENWMKRVIDAGADSINIHVETAMHADCLAQIKKAGKKAGLVVNPETPMSAIGDMLWPMLDRVIVMTVRPGFGGQEFIDQTDKIARIARKKDLHPHLDIMIDGGINPETARVVQRAGATSVVSGNALLHSGAPYYEGIAALRGESV